MTPLEMDNFVADDDSERIGQAVAVEKCAGSRVDWQATWIAAHGDEIVESGGREQKQLSSEKDEPVAAASLVS